MRKTLCKNIFPLLLFISFLLMSIGYASINSVSLSIAGTVTVPNQTGIFITSANYSSSVSADTVNSDVISAYQTNLNTNVVLTNEPTSSITYEITIYNSYDMAYCYDGYDYIIGDDTYSNENIIFKLDGMNLDDVINSGDSRTFKITFYYNDTTNITDTILKSIINFKFRLAPYVADEFNYSGKEEVFSATRAGIYKLEVWGAQGGSAYSEDYHGGYGAYSTGNIILEEAQQLYINVGGQGDSGDLSVDRLGGYNGGGSVAASEDDPTNRYVAGGGGATHIASVSGLLSSLSGNLDSILIVAGGGGGSYKHEDASYYGIGGNAGGIQGGDGSYGPSGGGYYGTGGTQTAPGFSLGLPDSGLGGFGYGGSLLDYSHGSAGGSGFYGGGSSFGSQFGLAGVGNSNSSGGGGSSYIGNSLLTDKYMTCYECITSDEVNTKTISTTNVSSDAISDYAKIGDGYVRITFVKEI